MILRLFSAVSLVFFLWPPAIWAEKDQVSTQSPLAYNFFKPATYQKLAMSPTGQYVAFVDSENMKACLSVYGQINSMDDLRCKEKQQKYRSKHTVRIFDILANKEIKRQSIPDNTYVRWFAWASDTRVLMGFGRPTTFGRGGRYYRGGSRIISIDMLSNDTATLFAEQRSLARQNRYLSRITNMLRGDENHIIMPAKDKYDLDLWKVNIVDGSAEKIATGKPRTFFWYTRPDGTPALRFDCVGPSCGKFNIYRYSKQSDSWSKIRTVKIKKLISGEDVWDLAILGSAEKENQLYVLADDDDDNFKVIRLFDYEKNEFLDTVYAHPEVDVSGAVFDPSTGEYAGAVYFTDQLHNDFVDEKLQNYYGMLRKYFGDEKNVGIIGWTNNKNILLAYVDAPNMPGSYYAFDVSARKVRHFLSVRPELSDIVGHHESEVIAAPMRDGSSIKVYLHRPGSESSENIPTIIMPHGGPEARDYLDYSGEMQYLLSQGFQVVQMNFRGSSGYGQKFAEKGYGEWGGLMQDDLSDTINYLFSKKIAKPEHTCVVGASYGAYAALMAAATTPELIRCAVGIAGPYDLMKVLAYDRKTYGVESSVYKYVRKAIGDPKKDRKKIEAVSPINLVHDINMPILLIHGKEDGIVDVKESRRMFRALKKAGVDVDYVELKDAGHNLGSLETQMQAYDKVVAFLNKHIVNN